MNNERYPFQITEYYSPGLNSLKRVYTQHPKFSGNERLIYELLFDYWNPDHGYAFPTISQLAIDSGLGESTVKRSIAKLKELDLLEVRGSDVASNNVYIVKKPVTTIEELVAKFPEVEAHMEQRVASIKGREASDRQRLKDSAKKPKEVAQVAADDFDW